MAGTSEGVKKSWLSRKRNLGKAKKGSGGKWVNGHPETEDTLPKGSNLIAIAKKWGVTVKQIIELNGITSVDQIVANMKLKIPALLSKAEKANQTVTKAVEANKKKKDTAAKKASKPKKPAKSRAFGSKNV